MLWLLPCLLLPLETGATASSDVTVAAAQALSVLLLWQLLLLVLLLLQELAVPMAALPLACLGSLGRRVQWSLAV